MDTEPTRIDTGYDSAAAVSDVYDTPTRADVSPLQALEAALRVAPHKPNLTLKVPDRPGVIVDFQLSKMNDDLRRMWQKQATKPGKNGRPDDLDQLQFSLRVIVGLCAGVGIGGELAPHPAGGNLTFAHRELWEMVGGVGDSLMAARRFVANDAHVLSMAVDVLDKAGFGDDMEEADPTTAS